MLAAEEDQDPMLLVLNCIVAGEAADEFGEMFGLAPGEMAQGFLDYTPNETYTESELEAFRWRKHLPAECPMSDVRDKRLANYVVDQVLAIAELTTGMPVTWEDIVAVESANPCEDAKALLDQGKADALKPRLAFIKKAVEMHHVLGKDAAPDGMHEQAIIWRAYWVGRWRERELDPGALQNYLDAFETFPEETQRHEEITIDTPMALFDESSDSSQQRLEAFGPIEWGGTEGLDMPSYIGRQQVWNYILSGDTSFPITPIDVDQARAWQPEIIDYLGGQSPGSEECAVVSYRTARNEINRVLRGSVGFVNEMRKAKKIATKGEIE
nr:hypothetical protein [Gammaproteobacteria bacterium]